MLKHGDKVNLTYYEDEKQKTLRNMEVLRYEQGLLKVGESTQVKVVIKFETVHSREEVEKPGQEQPEPKKSPKTKTMIFNLRSIGFLKVELV